MTYDLYGLVGTDVEEIKPRIERALGIELEPHDSFFIGEYYLGRLIDKESLTLRNNTDPLDGEPVETAFPETSVLIYIDLTNRAEEIKQSLMTCIPEIKHLRRKVQS